MRTFSRLSDRWVKPMWVLPLALVALPNCGWDGQSAQTTPRVPPGTTLVSCDIHLSLQERRCATAGDLQNGVRLAEAAVALAQGDNGKYVAIDDSPEALARCGAPESIGFEADYPAGMQVCVDPGEVGGGQQFATSSDVCVAKCVDLIVPADETPDPLVVDFCRQRAHASTNVPADPNVAFGGACSANGMPLDSFVDPRLAGEPVMWTNPFGVDPTGGNLVRTSTCTTTPCAFDAGAAGLKPVTHGDGYLEFSVSEVTTNRLGGLTTGPGVDDQDPNFTTIGFGIDLLGDGCFYVFENGAKRSTPTPEPGCSAPDAFGRYATGDRFRISFTDNLDGTARIDYAKLPGACTPGAPCPAPPFYSSAVHPAYPLHADAAFQDQGGALIDVRVVYIH